MKAKLLLAALALPAMFAACSQDELVTENVQQEFVGTPIEDLEFTATMGDASTRLNFNGWENGDKIGLGWISADGLSATDKLFSNHPLYYTGSNFKPETMIFEGLYIASYPWQNTQKIAPLAYDMTTQHYTTFEEAFKNRFYVNDKFVELTGKAAGLGNATTLTMVPLTNLVKINIKLDSKATLPEDIVVKGLTIANSGKWVNKLALDADNAAVAKTNSTRVVAAWTATKDAATQVNVGEAIMKGESVVGYKGLAIDPKEGLDVYVHAGSLAELSDAATTLKVQTNYGEFDVKSGTKAVTYSSKSLALVEATTDDFGTAMNAIGVKQDSEAKKFGQNISVNVVLDAKAQSKIIVSSQEDLDAAIAGLDKFGALAAKNATNLAVEFKKSTVKANKSLGIAAGDVILTDLSGLNRVGGTITFSMNTSAPTNVFIAGELNLANNPTSPVDFTVMKGQTLTIAKAVKLGNVIVNGTLDNKAALTVTGTLTINKGGLYLSQKGSSFVSGTFTNNGNAQWLGGVLTNVTGNIFAEVNDLQSIVDANTAFAANGTTRELVINTDLTLASLPVVVNVDNITNLTLNATVELQLGRENSFTFAKLKTLDIKKGSLSLTHGDTSKTGFYTITLAAGATVSLAENTVLNVAEGVELNTNAGTISYTKAVVNNAGYIQATTVSGDGVWNGNAVNKNPKA